MSRPSHDVDVAISQDPFVLGPELARVLGGTLVPLDAENRIARVVLPPSDAEGFQWNVDISALRGDIEQDLSQRDFTIDAMAIDLTGEFGEGPVPLLDPFGGVEDLQKGVIRTVSDRAFVEDPARLLRAVRLGMQLGFTLHTHCQELMTQYASYVKQVSPERLRDELCLTLDCPGADGAIRTMDKLGLLDHLLPELSPCKGAIQPKEHYWDVFTHSVEAVAWGEKILRAREDGGDAILGEIPWDSFPEGHFSGEVAGGHRRSLIFKLACLFHDLGKPSTKTIQPDGRIRFFGHSEVGAQMAAALLERLRFSNREIRIVQRMVELHLRPGQLSQEGQPPTARAMYKYQRDAGDVAIDTLLLNLADYLAAKGPAVDERDWKAYSSQVVQTLNFLVKEKPASMPKLVDGHDLMGLFGLKPGPQLKVLLEGIREAQAEGEIRSREEALALLARRLGTSSSSLESNRESL